MTIYLHHRTTSWVIYQWKDLIEYYNFSSWTNSIRPRSKAPEGEEVTIENTLCSSVCIYIQVKYTVLTVYKARTWSIFATCRWTQTLVVILEVLMDTDYDYKIVLYISNLSHSKALVLVVFRGNLATGHWSLDTDFCGSF